MRRFAFPNRSFSCISSPLLTASVRYDQDADGCHALLDEDAAEGRHRDGVACARLQFDTCTEYLRRQADYGGGQGVMRPDFRLSGWASSTHDARSGVNLIINFSTREHSRAWHDTDDPAILPARC